MVQNFKVKFRPQNFGSKFLVTCRSDFDTNCPSLQGSVLATLNVPDTLTLLVRHCPGFDRELAGRAAEAIEDGGGDVAMLDAAGVLGDHVAGRLIGPMREMQKETAQMLIDNQTQNTKMLAEQHLTTTKMLIDSQAAQNTKTAELFCSALQTLGNALTTSLTGKQLPTSAVPSVQPTPSPVVPVPVAQVPVATAMEPAGPLAHEHGRAESQTPAARQGEAPVRRRGRPVGSKDKKPRARRLERQMLQGSAEAVAEGGA